jgi:flagellar hook-associated protein 2
MPSSTINFSGLSSNIQWGDIVDATITADEARKVTPISDLITKRTAQRAAWVKLQGLVETLNESARNVRRTGFGGYLANVPVSPNTSRALLTAAPSLNAVPGRYRVEVVQLADTAKVAGSSIADTAAAMNLAGDFTVNGTAIAIEATDSLEAVRDKINAANTGSTPTGVTASIVKDGTTSGRLVLVRDTSGANGITISDGTGGMARELGFIDSRSKPISSATQAAAAAMGMAISPAPASIRVGNVVITADLSVDSLSSIAARINAAGGSAKVETEAYGDETRYRLVTDGNVSAVSGDPGSQDVIDALGIAAGKSGTISQTIQTGVYTDASDAIATTATALEGLKIDGAASGLVAGDAINIRGVRGDGTAVSVGIVIDPGDTIQTLLDKINDVSSGFGSGVRTATASLGPDGRIRLTDNDGGASRLALTLGVTHADGSTGSLGPTSIAVSGRSRELQEGRDAILRVDGQEYQRSSNTITDALVGTTLNLLSAEPGTAIDVVIDRDNETSVKTVQTFVESYNAIRTFFDEQRLVDSPLYANTLLRNVLDGFTNALRTEVAGNESYSRLTLAGVTLDRFGVLKMDVDKFKTALADKPSEIEALFGFSGVGGAFVTATDAVTQFGVGTISIQLKSIDQNAITLKSRLAEAQTRLEEQRERLVAQFTQMEVAISRLNAQRGSLASLTSSLQNSQN